MEYAGWEARAAQALPPSVLSYVAGGAGDENTQRANVTAFQRWGLIPRMFVGATQRDMSIELFGQALPSPLFMAPVGVIGPTLAEPCVRGHIPNLLNGAVGTAYSTVIRDNRLIDMDAFWLLVSP
jgi:hypothetical protein